jgi:hypothetical protein
MPAEPQLLRVCDHHVTTSGEMGESMSLLEAVGRDDLDQPGLR